MASPGLILQELGAGSALLLEDSSGLLTMEADVSLTFSVDTVIYGTISPSFPADAVLKTTNNVRSFTMEAETVAVITVRPGSDVDKSVATPPTYTSGTTGWNLVDEVSLTTDGFEFLVNNSQFLAMEIVPPNLPSNARGIKVVYWWNGTNGAPAGTAGMQGRNPWTGTRYDLVTIGQNVSSISSTQTTMPWGGGAWTAEALNRLQFGTRAPGTGPYALRTRQMYAIITYNLGPTFTIDAAFSQSSSASFTVDALITQNTETTFTVDAQITGAAQPTFTVDALIFGTVETAFTVDAVKAGSASTSFTADALLSLIVSGSFTLDAVLLVNSTEIYDDPFDDPATEAGTWGWRWTLLTGIEGSTAEFGRNPTKGAIIYDGSSTVLDTERGGYHWRGQYVRGSITSRAKLVAVDGVANVGATRWAVYLRHTGETSGLGYYTADYVAVEMLLNAGGTVTLQVRSNFETVLTTVDITDYLGTWSVGDEFYIKGWVKGTRVKGKVWRVGDPEPRWQINRNDLAIRTGAGWKGMAANTKTGFKPVEWNVRRAWAYNLDFSADVDAVIFAAVPGSFTADAITKDTLSGAFTLDASISVPGTGSFTADSMVSRPQAGSFTADADLLRAISGSLSADSIVMAEQVGSATIDAIVALDGYTLASFTSDAILLQGQSRDVTADAVVKAGRTGVLGVAAALLSPRTGSFTADSIRRQTFGGAWTQDAAVQAPRTQTLLVDAVVLGTASAQLGADAILFRAQQGSWSLDATIVRRTTVTLPASSVILRPTVGTVVLEAVTQEVFEGELSVGSVLLRPHVGDLSVDGVLRRSQASTFDAHSVLLRSTTGTFSLDAVRGLGVLPELAGEFVFPQIEAAFDADLIEAEITMDGLEATIDV